MQDQHERQGRKREACIRLQVVLGVSIIGLFKNLLEQFAVTQSQNTRMTHWRKVHSSHVIRGQTINNGTRRIQNIWKLPQTIPRP